MEVNEADARHEGVQAGDEHNEQQQQHQQHQQQPQHEQEHQQEQQDEDEEEPYLCKLFGTESRFIEFVNLTGRPVRLTSQLEMRNFANMRWSTRATIQPQASHTWRFLGDSPNLSLYFLTLLPDPYKLAFSNKYRWTVEYLDEEADSKIRIHDQMGSLKLQDLEELGPGETTRVLIQNQDKEVCSLADILYDKISMTLGKGQQEVEATELPLSIKQKLNQLKRSYSEIWNATELPCLRCKEIHG